MKIINVVLALALSVAVPYTANGESKENHRDRQETPHLSLWANYCEAHTDLHVMLCQWVFITNDLMASDQMGTLLTEFACSNRAQMFLADFQNKNPGYQRGYFKKHKCYPGNERPPFTT